MRYYTLAVEYRKLIFFSYFIRYTKMLDPITKFIFLIKKPQLVIVSDENDLIAKTLEFVLNNSFFAFSIKKINAFNLFRNKIFIFQFDSEKIDFFLKHCSRAVFIVNQLKGKVKTEEFIRKLKDKDVLFVNFDEEEIAALKEIHKENSFGFGFSKTADLILSDVMSDENSANFKVDFSGNIVPIWLTGSWSKKEILAIGGAIIAALRFNLNLIQISQILKNYKKT